MNDDNSHSPIHRCDNMDTKNITSFQVMIVMSVFLLTLSAVASYSMKKINLKFIVGMFGTAP